MKDLKILHPNHCSTAPETLMRPIWWWKTLKKLKKWCSQIVFPPFSRQDGFLATWDPYKMKDLKILHLNHCSTAPETLMRPCLCRFKVSNFMFFLFYFLIFLCFSTTSILYPLQALWQSPGGGKENVLSTFYLYFYLITCTLNIFLSSDWYPKCTNSGWKDKWLAPISRKVTNGKMGYG